MTHDDTYMTHGAGDDGSLLAIGSRTHDVGGDVGGWWLVVIDGIWQPLHHACWPLAERCPLPSDLHFGIG